MSPAAGTGLAGDAELLGRIGARRAEALAELYDRYSTRAYRVARSVCHDNERAEDAVQDAFLSIWRNQASFDPAHGSAAAWVLSIVRYRAIDAVRRNARHANHRASEELLEHQAGSSDVAEEALSQIGSGQLRNLLSRLPEAQEEVITLAFFGELSHTEIAAQLELPVGTVKGRMRLGLTRLRGDIHEITSR